MVLSVVPKGKSDWQAATQLHPAKRELPDYSKHDKVLAERPVKDDFDRSVQPKAADAVSVRCPPSGVQARQGDRDHRHPQRRIPAVSIMIALPGGIRAEGKGRAGAGQPHRRHAGAGDDAPPRPS